MQNNEFKAGEIVYQLTPKAIFILNAVKLGLAKNFFEGLELYLKVQTDRNLLLEMGYHKD